MLKNVVPLKSRLKVTGTDTNQSVTYDFLLTLFSNHEPISYCFRDKWRFQSKIANFYNSVYLTPPLKGFQLELGTDTRGNKIRMMGLPDGQNSFKIDLAISTQYQRVTNRRQDILR